MTTFKVSSYDLRQYDLAVQQAKCELHAEQKAGNPQAADNYNAKIQAAYNRLMKSSDTERVKS